MIYIQNKTQKSKLSFEDGKMKIFEFSSKNEEDLFYRKITTIFVDKYNRKIYRQMKANYYQY